MAVQQASRTNQLAELRSNRWQPHRFRAESPRMKPTRNMTSVRHSAPRRSTGLRILRGSLVAGAIGISPLLLYMLLGPADGNPIGLGLLAMLAVPVALIGGLIGLVTLAVERIQRAGR
jgi:hypothetical protein